MRRPTAADHAAIRTVVAAAFGRPAEADIVEAVRAEGAALVELVADKHGEIVGHVLFSRMRADPHLFVAALGPLAVRPDAQGQGHGQALTWAGLEALRALGAQAVVVLGHPAYYPRFGFSPDAARALASPYSGLPAFMALELRPGALSAPLKVAYPAAFG